MVERLARLGSAACFRYEGFVMSRRSRARSGRRCGGTWGIPLQHPRDAYVDPQCRARSL